jgi:hypothetical protein
MSNHRRYASFGPENVALDMLFMDTRNTYFPFDKAVWVVEMLVQHFQDAEWPRVPETSPPVALVMGYGDELLASLLFEVPANWTAENFITTVEFRWFEIFMQRNDALIGEGCWIDEEDGIAKAYTVTPSDWASSFNERHGLFNTMFCEDDDLAEALNVSTGRRRKLKPQAAAA